MAGAFSFLDGMATRAAIAKAARADADGPPHEAYVNFVKAATDVPRRRVFGWATVVTKAGEPVFDDTVHQDAMIPIEVENGAYSYMAESRIGKHQHRGPAAMIPIESLYFSKEKQEAIGIDLGFEGWWVGYEITDNKLLEAVDKGLVTGLSLGGDAIRIPAEA